MPLRVAILGIYHESNTFIATPTALDDFKAGHWLRGDAIRKEYQDSHHEIGGILEILDREKVEAVPLMFAEATPGGVITAETYEVLLKELLALVETATGIDGYMVIAHGAAVSERYPDMDGHWLSAIRQKTGEAFPIVGTLDPHANVSPLMAACTNALIAYKTNPHVDQRETGRQAALLMIRILNRQCVPLQHLVQLPLSISIEQQNTGSEPCKSLYSLAKQLSCRSSIISISILLGFPYADVADMGSAILVITDSDDAVAKAVGSRLREEMLRHRKAFSGDKNNIGHFLPLIASSAKPVLMLDMGDNIGAGSPGNSTFLLRQLLAHPLTFFICLCDAGAVVQACAHAPGDHFIITLTDDRNNTGILSLEAALISIHEGKFSETDPRHGGQVNFDMGVTAVISIENKCRVMLTSCRIPPFSLRQLTSCGIFPEHFDVIVAKGVNAPIAAYASVCPAVMQVNTPGVTQADMTQFVYKNRRIPMFPFEDLNA